MDANAQALAVRIVFLEHDIALLRGELAEHLGQAKRYQQIITEGQDLVRDMEKQLRYQDEHITRLERELHRAEDVSVPLWWG